MLRWILGQSKPPSPPRPPRCPRPSCPQVERARWVVHGEAVPPRQTLGFHRRRAGQGLGHAIGGRLQGFCFLLQRRDRCSAASVISTLFSSPSTCWVSRGSSWFIRHVLRWQDQVLLGGCGRLAATPPRWNGWCPSLPRWRHTKVPAKAKHHGFALTRRQLVQGCDGLGVHGGIVGIHRQGGQDVIGPLSPRPAMQIDQTIANHPEQQGRGGSPATAGVVCCNFRMRLARRPPLARRSRNSPGRSAADRSCGPPRQIQSSRGASFGAPTGSVEHHRRKSGRLLTMNPDLFVTGRKNPC